MKKAGQASECNIVLSRSRRAPACVAVEEAEAHAGVALHAVEEVHPKTLAAPEEGEA
jgi:hypothetical protein